MKFSYLIDPAQKTIFLRYTGRFTLPGLLAAARRLWADPAYCRTYTGLVDLSDISLSIAITDLHALIAFLRDSPETSDARWAAVTTSPFATACGLVYQKAMAARHVFEVFTSYEAASDFLRVSSTPPLLQECALD